MLSKIRLKKLFKKFSFYHSDIEHDYDSFEELGINDVSEWKTNFFNTKSNLRFKKPKKHLRIIRNNYVPSTNPSLWERASFSYFIFKLFKRTGGQ